MITPLLEKLTLGPAISPLTYETARHWSGHLVVARAAETAPQSGGHPAAPDISVIIGTFSLITEQVAKLVDSAGQTTYIGLDFELPQTNGNQPSVFAADYRLYPASEAPEIAA